MAARRAGALSRALGPRARALLPAPEELARRRGRAGRGRVRRRHQPEPELGRPARTSGDRAAGQHARRVRRAARPRGERRAPQLRAALERGERPRGRRRPLARREESLRPRVPRKPSPVAGDVPVQMQRTVRRGRYRNGTPAAGRALVRDRATASRASSTSTWRRSTRRERTIYLEDQAIGAPAIVDALHAALERGVDVVFLVPIDPNDEMAAGGAGTENAAFFERAGRARRARPLHAGGIAANAAAGAYQNVYVHAKVALVDDAWATIGSATSATARSTATRS